MSEPLYFLSYSRYELYFAEAVALALQKAGIKIWFDLQQLEPGCNWPEEIDQGLKKCSGVIVIASRGSLMSKYVADEWQHAIDEQKPIHVMLFEAVNFVHTIKVDPKTKEVLCDIHDEDLLKAAVSVVDARRGFANSINRMAQILNGQAAVHDPIPTPNRFNWPMKLPLAITFVMWAMVLATAFFGFLTIQAIPINLALAGIGLIMTGWVGNRTWAFIQRGSYRQARIILILVIILSAIGMLWLTPIFAAAAIIAMRAPDIHRYSPLGQGLQRGRKQILKIYQRRKQVKGIGQSLVVTYSRIDGLVKLSAISICILFALIYGLASLTALQSDDLSRRTGVPLALSVSVLLIIPLFLHFWLTGRYQNLLADGLGQAADTGLTYLIVSALPDGQLVEQVRNAMDRAGHTFMDQTMLHDLKSASLPIDPDFVIIILTTNTHIGELKSYKNYQGKLVILLADTLGDLEVYRNFQQYQWVDYRRQFPETLDAMAEDLLQFGQETTSNSVSTRNIPQKFSQVVIPGKVTLWLMFQYIQMDLAIMLIVFSFISGNSSEAAQLLTLCLVSGGLLISVWLNNRVINREITVHDLQLANLALPYIVYIFVFIIGTLRSIADKADLGSIFISVVGFIIGSFLGYRLGRAFLNHFLGSWLPEYAPFKNPFPGFIRDWSLWRVNLLAGLATLLLTLVIFDSQPVIVSDACTRQPDGNCRVHVKDQTNTEAELSLTVPDQWQSMLDNSDGIDITLDAPIAAVFRRGYSPLSRGFADTVTNLLMPKQTDSFSSLGDLPDLKLISAFKQSMPVADNIRLVKDVKFQNQFTVSILEVPDSVPSAYKPEDLLNQLNSRLELDYSSGSASNPVVQTQTMGSGVVRYKRELRFFGDSENIVSSIVVFYQAPSKSFILIIAGDQTSMLTEQAAIETALNSVQINNQTPQIPPGTN